MVRNILYINTSHFANDRYLLFKMHTILQNQWYLLYNRLSNMTFVCTLYILLILTQTFLGVVIGWNPSISAGERISCNGLESNMMNCSIYRVTEYPCTGGATIISCLPSGER